VKSKTKSKQNDATSFVTIKILQKLQILFRDMSNMAYGVEFERFGLTELAIATREVILSAGTIGSPKLLMLSGLGPRQHLQELGVMCEISYN